MKAMRRIAAFCAVLAFALPSVGHAKDFRPIDLGLRFEFGAGAKDRKGAWAERREPRNEGGAEPAAAPEQQTLEYPGSKVVEFHEEVLVPPEDESAASTEASTTAAETASTTPAGRVEPTPPEEPRPAPVLPRTAAPAPRIGSSYDPVTPSVDDAYTAPEGDKGDFNSIPAAVTLLATIGGAGFFASLPASKRPVV